MTFRYSFVRTWLNLAVALLMAAQYPVSGITALNVWSAKGGRIAVVACADGRRFSFPSGLKGFDELVRLLRTRANLPEPA